MCGIIAVSGIENASSLIYEGLKLLQHRGQESAGILVYDGIQFRKSINDGMVNEAIHLRELGQLRGTTGIGHVRYSTAGLKKEDLSLGIDHPRQPIIEGDISVIHNGNIVNYNQLVSVLGDRGIHIEKNIYSDTQLMAKIIASSSKKNIEEAIMETINLIKPTYSLIVQHKDNLYICRDRTGNRPLYIGRIAEGYGVASEERALRLIGAKAIEEVMPGEFIKLYKKEKESKQIYTPRLKRCVLESIYLATAGKLKEKSPVLFEQNLRDIRKRSGRILAREHPSIADLAIGILGSGYWASVGYSQESGIPFSKTALKRDPKYKKRTFIEPSEAERIVGVYLKFIPNGKEIAGKKLVTVDDTIVRLTTSSGLVQKLRLAGASELHMRVASPPILWPCFYGIDFPQKEELIASRLDVEEIEQYIALRFFGMDDKREELIEIVKGNKLSQGDIKEIIGRSDERNNYLKREKLQKTDHVVIGPEDFSPLRVSLGYLSLDGLIEAFEINPEEYCLACFTGKYEIEPELVMQRLTS